jgi:3'(2'), 5'-bisphosphate nucleotidase
MSVLRETCIGIARDAGAAIMLVYAQDFDVAAKADASPLTEADLAAHRIICAGLAALTPDIPVLSEESATIDWAVRSGWSRYWLVDPLDGTREFVKKNGEFTVNIALIEDGTPVLGVVVAPALGTAYWAARGEGAFVQRAGEAARPIRTREAQAPLGVMVSRSHAGPELAGFLERLGPHEAIPMGSSLKLCLVAEGRADLYPRLGPTNEWDIAAAHCILAEAGGTLRNPDGVELRYNKPSMLNPWFIAAGSHPARTMAFTSLQTAVSN